MLSELEKLRYAGIYLLKQIDLGPKQGGLALPLTLTHELMPLEPVLDQLVLDGWLAMDRKKNRYVLTPEGIEYIGTLIDEAETYIEEFDDEDADVVVAELRQRNLDPMRVRFLWGWYQGEFDDLALYQQRRGVAELDSDWASFVTSDAFYQDLARDLAGD